MKTKSKSKTKPTSKTQRKSRKTPGTSVVFILDRTGSMSDCREEAISAFNDYIGTLEKSKEDIEFTLVQFDSLAIETVHDRVPVKKVARLDGSTYVPRSMTNLNDAVGNTVSSHDPKGRKCVVVILTDGHENASSKWTSNAARELIVARENKDKWTFVFLGVGVEAWDQMRDYARGTQSVNNIVNITKAKGNVRGLMARVGASTVSYASKASGQGVCSSFFDEGSKNE